MIRPEDEEFKTYRFLVKDFLELIESQSKNEYTELNVSTKKLLKRVLTLPRPKGGILQIGWLSSAEYIGGEGIIELCFDPKLKTYLLQLKELFTQYRLKNVISLKSFYSIRMYEILKQYEKIGQRYLSLEELKHMLGVLPGKYNLYAGFKRYIILPAQKELSKHTDISFSFKEKKQGRKVIGFTFLIKTNSRTAMVKLKKIPQAIFSQELYQKLIGFFCFSPEETKQLIEKYKENRLTANLDYVEYMYKKGGIKNIRGYALKVIKENAKLQPSLFDTEKQAFEAARREEAREKRQEEQNQMEYSQYWDGEVERQREEMTYEELKEITKAAEKAVEATGTLRTNPISFDFSLRHAVDQLIGKKAGALSYEEWLVVSNCTSHLK